MKLIIMIFLSSFIIIKIVLGSLFMTQTDMVPLTMERNAEASESPAKAPAISVVKTDGVEDERIDADFLVERTADLKQREEALDKKKAELMAIQEEINRKLATLTKLRNEIRTQMAKEGRTNEANLKHLIKAYSAMKPQKAASLMEKVDITFAVELLSNMKGDVAGVILSHVSIDKAAKISERLAKGQ